MNDTLLAACQKVFHYPVTPHMRRHGPKGYLDYAAYKPWLRDEFSFRCVYCLTRERWRPDGHESFSVDHISPQATHAEQARNYDNLLYACCACNAYRQDALLPIDPQREPLNAHLRVLEDGVIEALSRPGWSLIAICQLDRPTLTQYRRRLLTLLNLLASRGDEKSIEVIYDLLGFPEDLPDLTRKRPPRGNVRPAGLRESCFVQRKHGTLPRIY